jgi:hypothetical protein
MARKILLDVHSEPVYITLIGVSCHFKDYRFTHLLNKGLGFSFAKETELPVVVPGRKEQSVFSFYQFRDEENYLHYSLIANRSEEFVLVPEARQVDFILVIEGEMKKSRVNALLKGIGSIQNVLMAYEIKTTAIKNIENLLTDIELHLMNIRRS